MTPQSGLQTIVESKRTLLFNNGLDNIDHTSVLRGLVLKTDLNKLKGNNNKGLSGTSSGTSKDSKGLGHGGNTNEALVKLSPFIIGSKLSSTKKMC